MTDQQDETPSEDANEKIVRLEETLRTILAIANGTEGYGMRLQRIREIIDQALGREEEA